MKLKKEFPIIAIILLPFVYLAYVWNALPETVAMQYNMAGEVSRYGSKFELLLIPIFLPLLTYLIFLLAPKIDPKKKLDKMGNKLYVLKFMLTAFMSVIAIYAIYSAKVGTMSNPNYIILFLGVLFIILGNYFQTIKANYFIGIRTPWTLESESVWKATHRMAGKLWFVGGLLVVLFSLLLDKSQNTIVFIAITAVITIIPIIYSYLLYKRLPENGVEHSA